MTKETRRKTSTPNSNLKRYFSFVGIKNSHKDDIIIIFSLTAITLYLLSLISFSPYDSSWFSASYPQGDIKNWIGSSGAWLSSLVIYFFGICAWSLPFPFFVLIMYRTPSKINIPQCIDLLLGWIFLFTCTTLALEIYTPFIEINEVTFMSGGTSGLFLKKFFFNNLGETGSYVAIPSFFLIGITFIFRLRIFSQYLPSSLSLVKKLFKYLLIIIRSLLSKLKMFFLRGKFFFSKKEKHKTKSSSVVEQDKPFCDILSAESHSVVKNPIINIPQDFQSYTKKIFNSFDLEKHKLSKEKLSEVSENIEVILKKFQIEGKVINSRSGPTVTIYEFQPTLGTKLSKIYSLMDDLALALKVDSIFITPVKNERSVGIQVPNEKRALVYLGNILAKEDKNDEQQKLSIGLGFTEVGEPFSADLVQMPHLLIAGATGTGKSVYLNSIICSLLYRYSPKKLRLLLIDPKMLELSMYNEISHLLAPVIIDPSQATESLKWLVNEMERRYKLMQEFNVRSVDSYNEKIKTSSANETDNNTIHKELSYIVVIIDELADLMLTSAKEIEKLIQRIAQKARASGIHMILATQRPSVDVITGVIKANLPSRVSFQVTSKHDSRTILDQMGAEKLLGKGDLLLLKPGQSKLTRLQGPFVSDEEVSKFVILCKKDQSSYNEDLISWLESKGERDCDEKISRSDKDEKYEEACEVARTKKFISVSYLQRELRIGYNRASRIVENMEQENLIGHTNNSKYRKWIAED
mgnify:CR=1 FL=1